MQINSGIIHHNYLYAYPYACRNTGGADKKRIGNLAAKLELYLNVSGSIESLQNILMTFSI